MRYPKLDCDVIESAIAGRIITSGDNWFWTGLADFMWGRLMAVVDGSVFVACLPFTHFADKVNNEKWSMTDCANSVQNLTPEQLEAAGGYVAFLQPGQAAVIPAGWIIFCASRDRLPDGLIASSQRSERGNTCGCAVFVVWMHVVVVCLACS